MTRQQRDDLKNCIQMVLDSRLIEQSDWSAVNTAIDIITSALDIIDLDEEET